MSRFMPHQSPQIIGGGDGGVGVSREDFQLREVAEEGKGRAGVGARA